eukprot:COSAG02_NODE_62116_length_266_cov_2.431138_1_plen_64_part_10
MLLLCGAYARAQKHYARLPLFVSHPPSPIFCDPTSEFQDGTFVDILPGFRRFRPGRFVLRDFSA